MGYKFRTMNILTRVTNNTVFTRNTTNRSNLVQRQYYSCTAEVFHNRSYAHDVVTSCYSNNF